MTVKIINTSLNFIERPDGMSHAAHTHARTNTHIHTHTHTHTPITSRDLSSINRHVTISADSFCHRNFQTMA